jgi:hypothetical protein
VAEQQAQAATESHLWRFKAGFQAGKSSLSKRGGHRERLPVSSGAAAGLGAGAGAGEGSSRGRQVSAARQKQGEEGQEQQEHGDGGRGRARSWKSKIHDSAATVTNLLFGRRTGRDNRS